MATATLSVLLGVVIGLSLGMLGGGGSILTVPALVYLVGLPVADATGTSLAIVGITALVGAVGHHRANRVALRTAAAFGAAGMAGSVLGSLLGSHVDGRLLLLLFALLMIAAGLSMLRRRADSAATPRAHGPAAVVRITLAGLGVGALTGFFGVGGGFVIVPALTLVLGLPMQRAVGTSLVVIALSSAAGLLTHLGSGSLDVAVTAFFIVGSVAGIAVGVRLAGRLPEPALRRGFAALVFVLAGYLLVRNAGAVVALSALAPH